MNVTGSQCWRDAIRRVTLLIAAVTLVLAIPLRPAVAQEAEEILDEEEMAQFRFFGEAGYTYQGKADIDGGGDVEVNRFDLGFVGRADLIEKLRWTNTFFFGVNDYDFGGGNAWDTILTTRLVSKLRYRLTEQWGIFGGGVFIFAPETGADWGKSFTGGGMLGADYRHSKTLFVSLGVAVISQLEDDPRVTPAVIFNWLPHEQWAVRVGAVPATGGAAAAAEVAYRVAQPVELGLGVLYNQRRFRLDDSGVVPDGVGEDNNLPVRLRVGWNITPEISLHVFGGVALSGELQLDDEDGNRLAKEDYDPAPYVGLRFLGGF